MTIAIYTHTDCLKHNTGPDHPERIERLQVILDALKRSPLAKHLSFVEAPLAGKQDLRLAHDPLYIESIYDAALSSEFISLDADTKMSSGSLNAALRAAGAGCVAVDDIMTGKYKTAFCAVRPPGHHATRDQAMGFCIFNNVAIAAFHALNNYSLRRVAIVDFDVHHGNGTQDIIAPDPRILYISTHQSPLWPDTGYVTENQEGHILNIPLSQGTDGRTYRKTFKESAITALEKFEPELLLVSAGFDAHINDPLAGLCLIEDDYRWIGEQLSATAEKCCGGKSVSFLEGGYNLQYLASSAVEYLSAWE